MNDQKWEHSEILVFFKFYLENHWSLCLRFWDVFFQKMPLKVLLKVLHCSRISWKICCHHAGSPVAASGCVRTSWRSLWQAGERVVVDHSKYRETEHSAQKVTQNSPHNCELFHANLWRFQETKVSDYSTSLTARPWGHAWLEDYSPLPDCQCLHLSLSVLRLKKPKGCDTKLQTLQRWVGGNWVAAVPLRHSPRMRKVDLTDLQDFLYGFSPDTFMESSGTTQNCNVQNECLEDF